MFIKRDRFLGKFKKGPPHIGEYDKKVHFSGGRSPMVYSHNTPRGTQTQYKYKIYIKSKVIKSSKNTKIRKNRYFHHFTHFIIYFVFILGHKGNIAMQ